jgi:sugar O-acyltransferase (sialic acid O-acetyltransferase NeuD family)
LQRELCVVLGSGAQGRVTLEVWRAARPDGEFVLLDDDGAKHGQTIAGAVVVGPFAKARELGGEVVIALGNNETRLAIARAHDGFVRWGNAIHPSAVVSPTATLGPGTVVFAGAIVNTGATIGAHAIVNTGAIVEHDSVIGDGASLSPGMKSGGRVVVEEGAFVSTGVTLSPRTKVGAWSVIGAGAVVVSDIPPRSLAYGVPARVVRAIDASFDWRRLL